MALPIEGFTVLAQKSRIAHLLDSQAVEVPNSTALADDDLWRCCFMAEADASKFIETLQQFGLNVSQGPDSDVVLVNEFDSSVHPYCEWLVTAKWEKAVVAWKAGTNPETIVARDGWDPKIGSGLTFQDPDSMDHLEFLRLEDQVEVYLNKETGKEVYIGRTSAPIKAMFKSATDVIADHFVTAGEAPVAGEDAKEVEKAVEMLQQVVAQCPDWWNAHWFLGKGLLALGNIELAHQAFQRAFELEKEEEAIPRELAGVCLELGKFDEAAMVAEHATAIEPDNVGLIGNLALAYLLAGRIEKAKKSITAAMAIDAHDQINGYLQRIIQEVADGRRPQPTSLASLTQ